ncbi:hypothetical protein F0562_013181 [Nyssa sinensis]|uniref:Uncharacterized protein n=1 Tax=Nyssa sinensis TaxID=561372 RepID=A0A5J4ZXM5_9ASTE|nr:hypothetical protein F0562_013181 [Nyssa sinensis]
MDAVEFPLPVAVTVSKLMGSDGFGGAGAGGGGVGVVVKEVQAHESDQVSILVGSSTERCSSLLSRKDEMGAVNASETALWNKMRDVEVYRHASQLSSFHIDDASEDINFGSTNSSLLLMPRSEVKQVERKSGKVAKSSSGCSRRSRMAQMEVSINEHGADDIKGTSSELGAYPAKCNIAEKTQVAKQKNHLNVKRGDKRIGKVPIKSKYDSFSLKAGLLSFSSSTGVNNMIGVYGLKQDIYDVTKHVDELSLNELLDGSYKCPSFARDKGKRAANLNENIMNSDKVTVTKEIPTLQMDQCIKFQDSRSKLKSPANMLDFPLYQPEDILERIALPPPKDLESLLLDAAKPALSSRNNTDPRLGKPLSHRAGLPPFPWSHSSGGHCKSNTDAVKLSTSRSTCQGRWVKIGNSATSLPGTTTDFLVDFESLAYDHTLVPSAGLKLGPLDNENVPSTSLSIPSHEWGLPSSTCSTASQVPPAEHSPRVLAAAQTLCEIATHSLKQNPHGMIRWPKKPSQKAMKARKLKSDEKSEEILASPKAIKDFNKIIPSKKPKLSLNEKSHDLGQTITMRKVPVTWSTPRSSRYSPGKSLRDSIAETKHDNANIVKQSCMLPPPSRVLDKACNSHQKLRKLVPMEWNRTGGKLD